MNPSEGEFAKMLKKYIAMARYDIDSSMRSQITAMQ
jgi:hypothetical protein